MQLARGQSDKTGKPHPKLRYRTYVRQTRGSATPRRDDHHNHFIDEAAAEMRSCTRASANLDMPHKTLQ